MRIVDFAIRGVPVVSPIPTAFVVANTVIEMLTERHWSFWLALIPALAVAIAIEGLGFGTIEVALKMRTYNHARRKRYNLKTKQVEYRDPHAPVGWAYAVVGIYLAVAVTFTMLTDVFPELRKYVFGVLPFLSALGAVLYALRSDHDERVSALATSKAEEKTKRSAISGQRSANSRQKVSESRKKVSEPVEEKPERFGKFKNWHQVPPEYQKEIAGKIPVTPRVQLNQWIQKEYGMSEKVAYNWIAYAERDYPDVAKVQMNQKDGG